MPQAVRRRTKMKYLPPKPGGGLPTVNVSSDASFMLWLSLFHSSLERGHVWGWTTAIEITAIEITIVTICHARMLAQLTHDINKRIKCCRHLRKILRNCLKLLGIFNVFVGLTIGFGLNAYSLPILTTETGLDDAAIAAQKPAIERLGKFHRNLEGSDSLHWGEGIIMVGDGSVWLDGSVSPGPDY